MKNFEFLVDSVGENNKAIKKLQTISKAIGADIERTEGEVIEWLREHQEEKVRFMGKSYGFKKKAKRARVSVSNRHILEAVNELYGPDDKNNVERAAKKLHVALNADVTTVSLRKPNRGAAKTVGPEKQHDAQEEDITFTPRPKGKKREMLHVDSPC